MKQVTGDHCSCWPDGDWGPDCAAHDKAYDKGGNHWDRLAADAALAAGIAKRGRWYGHGLMAALMFAGVRIFASRPVSFLTRGVWGKQHRFNWGQKRKGGSDAG